MAYKVGSGRSAVKAFCLSLALLLALPAHADDFRKQKIEAASAHAFDVATTGAGLAVGAAESNPLGLLLVPAKLIAYQRIKASPEAEQPGLWAAYEAFGWGAAANNLCVIAQIASGGFAPCLAVGVAAGLVSWAIDSPRRKRAEFDAVCEQAKASNHEITCVWNSAQTIN
jgi:hypothetical protein